nr:hypothetical protein [Streptomyces acidiscabies]
MAYTAPRNTYRDQPEPGRRHPLTATLMVLPLAVLLFVVFGGWETVATQASSVGVMLER